MEAEYFEEHNFNMLVPIRRVSVKNVGLGDGRSGPQRLSTIILSS